MIAFSTTWITRRARLLLTLCTLVLLYAVAGFFWLPGYLREAATHWVQTDLKRQLTLEQVRFNPFTLTLQVDGATLTDSSQQPIAHINHLMVNAALDSIFGTPHLQAIVVDGPAVHVRVDANGKLNLDFSDGHSADEPVANQPPSTIPALRIDSFALRGGSMHIEDLSRPEPFDTELKPIQFSLSNFRTEPLHANDFQFKAVSASQESFEWAGEFTVQPLGSRGTLKIAGLQTDTLKSYAQDALPFELLGGTVDVSGSYQLSIGQQTELTLNLPTIAAHDARVGPKPATDNQPWVALKTLALHDTQVSLQQRQLAIDRVQIDGGQLTAWFDAGYQLNLLQLLGPDEPPSATPWHTRVRQIDINDTHVAIADRTITPAAQFELSPVQMQIDGFDTAPGSRIQLNTALRINDAAQFSAKGSVDLDTTRTQLAIQLRDLPLTTMQPYADTQTDVLIDGGTLQAQGDLSYRGSAAVRAPELQFKGLIEVSSLATRDKVDQKDFIRWQSLRLEKFSYAMAPDALSIGRILARQPFGRVIINSDGSSNIQHVLRMPATRTSSDNTPAKPVKDQHDDAEPVARSRAAASKSMPMKIDQVIIDDGSADFTDNTVQPVFATGMQGLRGSITGLSSDNGSRAKVELNGSVDRHAPVAITGEANFLAADTYSDLSLNFRNMELTTFNPYSGKFAGYSIAKGKLSTELRYQIRDRQLDAQHHIIIDQLEFGAATDSKDAVPLPIKLVVSLLKDRNGVIDLQLPVGGSLDDPSFRIGPIVWKAVLGLFSKIATAPFAALGRLFGGGDELAYVDFAPGDAALTATEQEKLAKLSKGLVERPQLKINVPLTVITDADAAALNEAAYQRAVTEALPNASAATPAQRLAALTSLYQRKTGNAPVANANANSNNSDNSPEAINQRLQLLDSQLRPLYAIAAADRDVLTRARADAVQAALLANTELSAERVFLTATRNEATSPAGVVRMALTLE